MKIAFIGQKQIPAKSGKSEKNVEEVAKRLAQLGHEVFVYASGNGSTRKPMMHKGMKLIYVPKVGETFFASLHTIFCDYDVVHYQGFVPAKLSIIAKIFKWQTAVVATFHDQDYCHQTSSWFGKFLCQFGEFFACTIPDKIVATSEVLAKWAKEKYQREVIVIQSGIDVHSTKKTDVLSKWKLRDRRYVLFVGSLIKRKGAHYLIEAFKQLEDTAKTPNNFKLVIVSDGFSSDDYVRYLQTIAKGRDNIIFAGNQTNNNLDQLISHAYLFVDPSESEGMPSVLLESMCHGLVALVSNAKENIKVIGEDGYSFVSKSVSDLGSKLAYLLNRPDEVAKMGILAKRRVKREYSWDSVAEKFLEIYKQILLEKRNEQRKIITHEAK